MTLALEGFSGIGEALLFMVACIVTSNFVFSRALGVLPFSAKGDHVKAAAGIGVCVAAVMTAVSFLGFALYQWVLVPLDAAYLSTICFLALIAAVTFAGQAILKKKNPDLGMYFPLVMGNGAVLGVVLLNTLGQYGLVKSVLSGLFGGIGFLVAIVLIVGVRERLETSKVPKALRGFPITLVSAGLMSLAFMGFMGIAGH
ncbi:MAG TPA: Rnf-Nqr domain containing protein [Feifaniaceae bacterium]|nr:Rnf-Nqr domain containing protein [Feifaniaceae bacterium]